MGTFVVQRKIQLHLPSARIGKESEPWKDVKVFLGLGSEEKANNYAVSLIAENKNIAEDIRVIEIATTFTSEVTVIKKDKEGKKATCFI